MREMINSGQEWLGNIPANWDFAKIDSLYKLRNTKVSDYEYEPLSVTMSGVVPQLENAAKTNAHDDRKLVLRGDFAINSRSDRRGSCGISEYDGSISLINTVLKPNGDMMPGYFNWLFHTESFADEFYRWGHGIVDDLWTTNWQDMRKIVVPVPSMSEQQRIASFLDSKCTEIDSIIADIQKEIETLQEYRKSVITEAVTRGLDSNVEMKDSGIDWIGMIPKHWGITKISNSFNLTLGKMVETNVGTESDWSNYICAANIKWEGVDTSINKKMYFSEYEKKQYLLEDNDILIMEGGSIGTSCVYHNEFNPCYIQNSVHRCRPLKDSIAQFLYYWMTVVVSSGYVESICNKATIMHYTKEKLSATPICTIPYEEQLTLVQYLDAKCSEIDPIIEDKQKQLDTLTEYRKSLIYEYVTGKKEVPSETA